MGATLGGSIRSSKSVDYLGTPSTTLQKLHNPSSGTVGGFSKLSNRMKQKKKMHRRKMSASFTSCSLPVSRRITSCLDH